MVYGPTAPEPPTEGKDLSGGFVVIRYQNASYSHHAKVHVAPFTIESDGSLLYNVPPAGPFSEAAPDVTAANLMAAMAKSYTADWEFSLQRIAQIVSGVITDVYPLPSVTPILGVAGSPSGYVPDGQITFTTRDTAGGPFRFVLMGSDFWAPNAPLVRTGGTPANWDDAIVNELCTSGAVRSQKGNKPVAPMRLCFTLNRRLHRTYHRG